MTHYFKNDPNLKHNRKQIKFRFLGVDYILESDAGVFSKDHVDTGTQLMLQHIGEGQISDPFLDFGCGYGVVSCVVKTMAPQLEVIASDINQRAVELSKINVEKYNLDIEVIQSDGFENIHQKFKTIAFNPPIKVGKEKMYGLLAQCHAHLYKKGVLIIVIRKDQGAKSAIAYLQTLFEEIRIIIKKKGFWVISCEKA